MSQYHPRQRVGLVPSNPPAHTGGTDQTHPLTQAVLTNF